jgi:hypothetical protein
VYIHTPIYAGTSPQAEGRREADTLGSVVKRIKTLKKKLRKIAALKVYACIYIYLYIYVFIYLYIYIYKYNMSVCS